MPMTRVVQSALTAVVFFLAGTNLALAQCPMATDPKWTYEMQVEDAAYFRFGAGWSDVEKEAARSAFARWTTANTTNRTEIFFTEGDAPPGKVQITLEIGSSATDGDPGASIWPGGDRTRQTIQLDLNNAAGTNYCATCPGYVNAITKAVGHEIGHGMGLDDIPGSQTQGASIMNGFSGINDIDGLMPLGPTEGCDNSTVQSIWTLDEEDGESVEEEYNGVEWCDYHYIVRHHYYWNGSQFVYLYTSYTFTYYDNCQWYPEGSPAPEQLLAVAMLAHGDPASVGRNRWAVRRKSLALIG